MSLNSLIEAAAGTQLQNNNMDLKFVFVGGKGGVGKTTSSSAIATLLAQLCHKRVLLVSTDPAHSLGDAWRTQFSHEPKRIPLGNNSSNRSSTGTLDIMELDPHESLQGKLDVWAKVSHEIFGSERTKSPQHQSGERESKISQFQEWLSGIPGIDEAMALSAAIRHIESGNYDWIVFDTAPTGHTLKLLALPDILDQGIDKLQSWQTTFWSYWQVLKSGVTGVTGVTGGGDGSSSKPSQLKDQVTHKLMQYKRDIQKVACMLQDQHRTRFVVVCIAEFLSVSETQRLLQELAKHKVVASHIVVNQLVVQDALTSEELTKLESLAEVGQLQMSQALLQKTVHACRLTTARKNIQQRYLNELKGYPETQSILERICQVPLLAEEVTGTEAIQRFSQLLVKNPNLPRLLVDTAAASSTTTTTMRMTASNGVNLYDNELAQKNKAAAAVASTTSFVPGDTVQITGLAKSPQFNNLQGKVMMHKDPDTGRFGVNVAYNGKTKALALHPQNLLLVQNSEKKSRPNESTIVRTETSHNNNNDDNNNNNDYNVDERTTNPNPILDKAKKLLEDPEIKRLVDQNPKLQSAVQECLANPMMVMQYLGDPEMAPFLSQIMAKLM